MPKDDHFYELQTGVRVRLKAVPAFLIDRVQSQVPMPEPPMFVTDDGRHVPNPTDPDYITAVQQAQTRQIATSVLAAVIFGVELVNENGEKIQAPPPEEDDWEAKLTYLGIDWREQLSADLPMPEGTDLSFARTACYLLYTQMSTDDTQYIASVTMGSGEAYNQAVNTFQGAETRRTNPSARTKRRK